jgi:hypothetical protein
MINKEKFNNPPGIYGENGYLLVLPRPKLENQSQINTCLLLLPVPLSLSLSSPTRPALPRDLPLPVLAAVLSLYLFDPAMAAPAPATAGELLRIDPLELRFPCTCSSALSPALFCFSSFFGVGGKSLFFYLPCFCRRGSIGSWPCWCFSPEQSSWRSRSRAPCSCRISAATGSPSRSVCPFAVSFLFLIIILGCSFPSRVNYLILIRTLETDW